MSRSDSFDKMNLSLCDRKHDLMGLRVLMREFPFKKRVILWASVKSIELGC